jgi:hypothetical protein
MRSKAATIVERQLAAAMPLLAQFSDEDVDYASVERSWITWRDETRHALPRRLRVKFTSADLTGRRVTLAGRPIGSAREAAAALLDWDIYRLRKIRDHLGRRTGRIVA